MDNLIQHWGIFTSVLVGLVSVLLYFVKNWRAVEELKANCLSNQQKADILFARVDDYHIAAVARESKLRDEMKVHSEAIRTEAIQQRSELRREMVEVVMKLTEKLTHIDKTMVLVEERTKILADFSKDQQSRNTWADRILSRLDTPSTH